MQNAVLPGRIGRETGGLLSTLETDRLVTDYEGDQAGVNEARNALGKAEAVVNAVRTEFLPELDVRVDSGSCRSS